MRATQVTTSDLRGQVGRIQNQVKEIQEVVRMYSSTTGPRRVRRSKVEVMSQEAQETNPYSRLMALKTMGVVKNYERVRDFSVAIVGIGGVGVGVVEMLARCGIGKIIVYDFDTIELANMNKCAPPPPLPPLLARIRIDIPAQPSAHAHDAPRALGDPRRPAATRGDPRRPATHASGARAALRMFYRPEQTGWNKTMACRHYCSELNPDVTFEVHNMNITTEENRAKFKDTLTSGSLDRKEVCACACACSCALARQGGWVGACSLDRKEVSVRKECVRVSLSLSLSLSARSERLGRVPRLCWHSTPRLPTARQAAQRARAPGAPADVALHAAPCCASARCLRVPAAGEHAGGVRRQYGGASADGAGV